MARREPGNPRDKQMHFGVTQAEKDIIQEAARIRGDSDSDFMRAAIMDAANVIIADERAAKTTETAPAEKQPEAPPAPPKPRINVERIAQLVLKLIEENPDLVPN